MASFGNIKFGGNTLKEMSINIEIRVGKILKDMRDDVLHMPYTLEGVRKIHCSWGAAAASPSYLGSAGPVGW